jgi:ParB family transcriptional regulator, chromosome partitioning protein
MILSAAPLEKSTLISTEAIALPDYKPRRYFDPSTMQGLIKSIQDNGILEPLLVRPLSGEIYELVAGERRLRAAQAIGLIEVPILIRELSDQEALKHSLIENLLREDLNPLEETETVLKLLALSLSLTTEQAVSLLYRMQNDTHRSTHNVMGQLETQIVQNVFAQIGMSWESFVNNRLPLLKLPEDVLTVLREGQLAYTKAKAISLVKDASVRQDLLSIAISQKLSLSQIRKHIAELLKSSTQTAQPLAEDGTQSIKSLLDSTYRSVKKSKVWHDPSKQEQLKQLLEQLNALISEGF